MEGKGRDRPPRYDIVIRYLFIDYVYRLWNYKYRLVVLKYHIKQTFQFVRNVSIELCCIALRCSLSFIAFRFLYRFIFLHLLDLFWQGWAHSHTVAAPLSSGMFWYIKTCRFIVYGTINTDFLIWNVVFVSKHSKIYTAYHIGRWWAALRDIQVCVSASPSAHH